MNRKIRSSDAPQNRDSLNRAATGLFEPSQNPNAQLPKDASAARAEQAIDAIITKDIIAHSETDVSGGQVEQPGDAGPNDRIVGPDIGSRPHLPGR